MNKFLFSLTVFTAIFCLSTNAGARELIKEFKGSESATTAEFEIEAPWIADWRVAGDYPGQMAVEISLVNDVSSEYVGKIATTKYVTNGVKLFNEGGRFHFQIDSSLARWTIRVVKLTREEAETYKPKEKIQ